MSKRLSVPKTYKLFIGGAFPRSESGRTYEVLSAKGDFLANAALASRKDARDAVVAARGAIKGWSGATAYNRGQVLYRVAEILEGRRAQFVDEIVAADRAVDGRGHRRGRRGDRPLGLVRRLDRQVQPGHRQRQPGRRPVLQHLGARSRPAWSGSSPRRTRRSLGLVSVVAPALVAGNTVVVVAAERLPLSAISLAEVLATSDVPAGVVNVLTGSPAEIAPWLASHPEVHGLDLAGAGDLEWVDLQIAAAETLTRVLPPQGGTDAVIPSLHRITAFTEIKTVWHPKSLV